MYDSLKSSFYRIGEQEHEALYKTRFNDLASVKLNLWIKSGFGNDFQLFYVNKPEISLRISRIYENVHAVESTIKEIETTHLLNDYYTNLLADEIVASNGIEGVKSTRDQILHAKEARKPTRRFFFLVKKYERLINDNFFEYKDAHGIGRLYKDLLSQEIEEENKIDGDDFRLEPVEVLSSTGSQKVIHKSTLSETEIITSLNQALLILNDPSIPKLVGISIFHYYFGYIHPFYDGNGRISRYISSSLLKNVLGDYVPMKLSKKIFDHKSEYYKAFEDANHDHNKGELTLFIQMFLGVIENAAEEVFNEISEYKIKLMKAKNYSLKNTVLKDLGEIYQESFYAVYQASFYNLNFKVKDLSAALDVSDNTARKYLTLLAEKGILYKGGVSYKVLDTVMVEIEKDY